MTAGAVRGRPQILGLLPQPLKGQTCRLLVADCLQPAPHGFPRLQLPNTSPPDLDVRSHEFNHCASSVMSALPPTWVETVRPSGNPQRQSPLILALGALYINFKLKEDVAFAQPFANLFLLMTLIST